MNKKFLNDNANYSPSIRRLRSGRTIKPKPNVKENLLSSQSIIPGNVDECVNEEEVSEACTSNQCKQIIEPDRSIEQLNFRTNVSLDDGLSDRISDSDLSLSGDSIASSDSENEEDETFYEALTVELNKLSVATNELELTKTNRDGLKLCSLGLYFTKERTTKRENKTHWRCERTSKCSGRAHTIGLDPPVLITVAHNHKQDLARKSKLINDVKMKKLSLNTKENPRSIM
ncbi:hypothetical protein BpHYR1_038933, partial [Brachionus plicatilis]